MSLTISLPRPAPPTPMVSSASRPTCAAPARSGIISTVLQVIANVLASRMDPAAAVAAPRLHHQWLPDEVRTERGFTEETLAALRAKGHRVLDQLGQTSANTIAVTDKGLLGAPDPRTRGAEAAGY